MAKYEHHEFCDLFPDLLPSDLQVLADDISEHGLQQPIVRWKGRILDGKNRLAACELSGRRPEFVDWFPSHPEDEAASEKEALDFVLGANLHRRQLTESQRAVVCARVERLQVGDNQHVTREVRTRVPTSEVAKQLDVSPKSVYRAAKVLQNGAASLVDAVEHGEVTVNDAVHIVDLPKPEQAAAVKAVRNGKAKTVTAAAKPRAAGQPSGGPTFDPAEFDHNVNPDVPPSKVSDKLTLAERIAQQPKILESFCRGVAKFFEDTLPEDPWLDDGQLEIARSQLKSCLGAIRAMKCHDKPCPKCGGKGCKACRGCGYMPKQTWEMMGGK